MRKSLTVLAAVAAAAMLTLVAACSLAGNPASPRSTPDPHTSGSVSASPAPTSVPKHVAGAGPYNRLFTRCIQTYGWGNNKRVHLIACVTPKLSQHKVVGQCITNGIAAMWAKFHLQMVLSKPVQKEAFGFGKNVAVYCLLKNKVTR